MIWKIIKIGYQFTSNLFAFLTVTYAAIGLLIQADLDRIPETDIRIWLLPFLLATLCIIERIPESELKPERVVTWEKSMPMIMLLIACLIYILLPLDFTVYTIVFILYLVFRLIHTWIKKKERKKGVPLLVQKEEEKE